MASAKFANFSCRNLLPSTPISPNSCVQMFCIVKILTKGAAILNKVVQYFIHVLTPTLNRQHSSHPIFTNLNINQSEYQDTKYIVVNCIVSNFVVIQRSIQ